MSETFWILLAPIGLIVLILYIVCSNQDGHRKECVRLCDSALAQYEFNTYGSDKCYCPDKDGKLTLKKVF